MMIMQDFIKFTDRLDFENKGVGRSETRDELIKVGHAFDETHDYSKITNSGFWYCHDDGYTNSR